MAGRPFATILVPSYNQEAFLGQALDSLLAQTDPDWEAIIINDGSTDSTSEIAEEYVRCDSRFRCIHKPNGGVASALNAGLHNARGEWIHWLSSDDMFEPNKLEINRSWAERHPECNFFFSYFTLLREATGARERRELWGPVPHDEHQILTLFFRNYISGISICVRRSEWEATGFFNEALHYAQDYDRWLYLLQNNQGVFIPEWTVISRNHAAQGSEIFPDACYFDTAKAAICFINAHSFPELVPWANLTHGESAIKAVTYALEVACERSAFLYCLGPHPALVLRLLEWAFANGGTPEIQALVGSRIEQMSFQEGDDDWAWMWRQLAVVVHGGGTEFEYSPIDPTQLALMAHRSRRRLGDSSHTPLRDYLARFENIDVDSEFVSEKSGARLVLLVDQLPEVSNFLEAAITLASRGYRPVVLITGNAIGLSNWQWCRCVPVIRVAAFDKDTLPWLGEVELAVRCGGEIPVWLGTLSQLKLEHGLETNELVKNVLVAMGEGCQQTARPVVFLERVLWGGGAERVVFDIVRYLDRKRFKPVILTMVEEHTVAPELPADVEVFNVRRIMFGDNCLPPAQTQSCSDSQQPVVNQSINPLRKIYHQLFSSDARQKIGLGRWLLAIKGISSSPRQHRHVKSNEQAEPPIAYDAPVDLALDFDYIQVMAHHNPAAVGLVRAMNRIGKDAAIIAVMEEAAVTAWLAQAVLRTAYAVSLHSLESKCLRDIYPAPSRFAAEWRMLSAACDDANVVTLPSQGCCVDLREHLAVSRAQIRKLWNPVDCARVRRLSFHRIEAAEQWRKRPSTFRMVHVGRLDQQKNHDLLLSACVELKNRDRSFSLVIVGEGSQRSSIEERIRALELDRYVKLVGEQINPFPWMAAADALLLTSRFEAFALVLVEAMVCGTPVISVDCPAGPAEILDNGKFGLLVPNDDPASLADAVERLMDEASLACRMSELGYERAEVFDIKNIVPHWEMLIDALPPGQG